MAQEVDHFGDLSLGSLVAGDVGEAGRWLLFVVDLGLRPSESHDAPGQLLGVPAPDPDEERDEEQQREERQQIGQESRALSDAGDVDIMGLQRRGQLCVADSRGDLARVVVTAFEGAGDRAAGVDRGGTNVARGDFGQELRIREALGGRVRHVGNQEQKKREEDPRRQEPHAPARRRRTRRCRRSIIGTARFRRFREVTDHVRH